MVPQKRKYYSERYLCKQEIKQMPSQDALAMLTSSDQKERTRPEARKSVSSSHRMTFREVNVSEHFNVIRFLGFEHFGQDVLSGNEEN